MTDGTKNTQASEMDVAVMRAAADITIAAINARLVVTTGIPDMLRTVRAALAEGASSPPAPEKQIPAVDPKKSIREDSIICLEDGKAFKSLKRHLMSHYGLTPDEYRQKWGLPSTYPMVAPNYAAARSVLAKKMGLGRKPGNVRRAA